MNTDGDLLYHILILSKKIQQNKNILLTNIAINEKAENNKAFYRLPHYTTSD